MNNFIVSLFITILPIAVVCAIIGGIARLLIDKGETRLKKHLREKRRKR